MRQQVLHIIVMVLLAVMAAACNAEAFPEDPSFSDDYAGNVIQREFKATDLVTVKRNETDVVYLQYGNFKLLADGLEFQRQQRAMADMTVYPEIRGGFYVCSLSWIEPLDEGIFGGPSVVPQNADNAPLDILLSSSYTRVEDGYLNLMYSTWWGETPLHHDFYLISNPDNPYSLTFVQDSHGDARSFCSEGLICFDINNLPDTGGETVNISISWTKLDGTEGTAYFGFKTRE